MQGLGCAIGLYPLNASFLTARITCLLKSLATDHQQRPLISQNRSTASLISDQVKSTSLLISLKIACRVDLKAVAVWRKTSAWVFELGSHEK